MSDSSSKLDALGDLLGVQDDTTEIDRTPQRRPAVGDVLRGDAASTQAADPTEIKVSTTPPAPVAPVPIEQPPAAPERRAPRQAATVRQTAAPRAGRTRQRSSANLPIGLADRLSEAKRHRWELSALVASALDHTNLDPTTADRFLEESWNDTRVQRAYQATADDVERLDALGDRWRMNRSQVLAVILPRELDRLGL